VTIAAARCRLWQEQPGAGPAAPGPALVVMTRLPWRARGHASGLVTSRGLEGAQQAVLGGVERGRGAA